MQRDVTTKRAFIKISHYSSYVQRNTTAHSIFFDDCVGVNIVDVRNIRTSSPILLMIHSYKSHIIHHMHNTTLKCNTTAHSIFFDDCVGVNIVDVRNIRTSSPIHLPALLNAVVHRVDTLAAITNENYYIRGTFSVCFCLCVDRLFVCLIGSSPINFPALLNAVVHRVDTLAA
jgi:hypothetical protein